ncbi:MAG: hypothetical protein IKV40_03125 [Clostridia bacterium]|nr:hypothetical protein [Clostridia bacterium]
MIENSGIPNDAIADLLESKFADEVLTSLADGISSELLGTKPNATYDEEYFKDLCLKNKDHIMEFLERYPEAEGASDEELDEAFDNFVTEIPAQLAGTITELSAELDGTDDAVDYGQMYQIAVKQLPIILTVNSFILLVICWLLRIKFTYGLLWPGVTSVVGGTITALLSMLIGSSTATMAEFAEATYIIPILNILSEKLLIGSTVPLAIGIALIVAKAIITKKALNSEETNESCIRN